MSHREQILAGLPKENDNLFMFTLSIPIFHLWTLNKQEDVRLSNLGTIFTIGRIFVL